MAQPEWAGVVTQIRAQARALVLFLPALYFLPLCLLLAIAVASRHTGVEIAMLTRDPAAVANIHPFVGVASNVGVLLWTASATICLFSWAVLQHRPGEGRLSTFLLCSGLLTALLLFDDFFLLHDRIFPRYLDLEEGVVFGGYWGLTVYGMWVFRNSILRTEYLILLVALWCFGMSMVIDVFQERIEPMMGPWRILLEDGFKLLGIVGWLGYFSRSALGRLAHSPKGGTSV